MDHKAIKDLASRDGIFPLITNAEMDAAEVLKAYKNQPYLEKRMYTAKSILKVAPVFLKKTERIEAMTFLYFIALMIVSLKGVTQLHQTVLELLGVPPPVYAALQDRWWLFKNLKLVQNLNST